MMLTKQDNGQAVPCLTINKNRKSINKEYYVSEVEDKSSVEYSKKRSV